MSKKVLVQNVWVPFVGDRTAEINISAGTGNLAIDPTGGSAEVLMSGTVEYMEGQDAPAPSLSRDHGHTSLLLTAQGGRRPGLRMPWSACNAETNWHVHLNPAVCTDIIAHSGGGNVRLELGEMAVTSVSADTGGGNMELALPAHASGLHASARSGAGNVTVALGPGAQGASIVDARSGAGNVVLRMPRGLAARIHASSGMGKLIVDPCYNEVEKGLYQSADFESAADRADITLHSGAGNVIVETN